MKFIEGAQPRDHPADRKRRTDTKRQQWRRAHRGDLFGNAGDGVERRGQAGLQRLALQREVEAVRPALEQLKAEPLLQQPHHPADGRLRHVQFGRSADEAAVAGSRLERAQSIQRRQASHRERPTFPEPMGQINPFARALSNPR